LIGKNAWDFASFISPSGKKEFEILSVS
jgi:hypothetical protein